jgi:hypothetical protein
MTRLSLFCAISSERLSEFLPEKKRGGVGHVDSKRLSGDLVVLLLAY